MIVSIQASEKQGSQTWVETLIKELARTTYSSLYDIYLLENN